MIRKKLKTGNTPLASKTTSPAQSATADEPKNLPQGPEVHSKDAAPTEQQAASHAEPSEMIDEEMELSDELADDLVVVDPSAEAWAIDNALPESLRQFVSEDDILTDEGPDEQVSGLISRRKPATTVGLGDLHIEGVDLSEVMAPSGHAPDMKKDHHLYPILISETGRLLVETFSPLYHTAVDFIAVIAEPVRRPTHVHEYALTMDSLFSAANLSLTTEEIINTLYKLSKTKIPRAVLVKIKSTTQNEGKVKLVLKQSRYFIESEDVRNLEHLLKHSQIKEAVVYHSSTAAPEEAASLYNRDVRFTVSNAPSAAGLLGAGLKINTSTQIASSLDRTLQGFQSHAAKNPSQKTPQAPPVFNVPAACKEFESRGGIYNAPEKLNKQQQQQQQQHSHQKRHLDARARKSGQEAEHVNEQQYEEEEYGDDEDHVDGEDHEEDSDHEDVNGKKVYSFEISKHYVNAVKKKCSEISFPLSIEYDFKSDKANPNLKIDLKITTRLRPYQEKSLSRMFSNGRARSGIVVLPCGAGKTLTGVTMACTVKKRVLILTITSVAVDQWYNQLLLWSTLDKGDITRFTSGIKEMPRECSVVISTYNMIVYQGKRSYQADKIIDFITSREWGLLIMDEVHVTPAKTFQNVLSNVSAHCKVGLTATLVREDDKIPTLRYLIGPKLFEAEWKALERLGYIAKVKCFEVRCEMTPEFYAEYLRARGNYRGTLCVFNPNKFRACQYLCIKHASDKVVIFFDNVEAIEHYARMLSRPFISGKVPHQERNKHIEDFIRGRNNIILFSKVGDTALDIPDANVLIQVSSHFGARRQEAQRFGRISRAKSSSRTSSLGDYNAWFYSLVSTDTQEIFYSSKRKQFLVDQGYWYETVDGVASIPPELATRLPYSNLNDRASLLAYIRAAENLKANDESAQGVGRSSTTGAQHAHPLDKGGDPHDRNTAARKATSLSSVSGASNMAYGEYKYNLISELRSGKRVSSILRHVR